MTLTLTLTLTRYEEYKTRTQRRGSAALKVEEQDAGGRSKATSGAREP